MKKGLMILLMSLSLISFAVSAGLACEPIAPAQTESKAYSLQEFLDSVYAYELKTGEFRLGAGSVLTGSDNLIELTVKVEIFGFVVYAVYFDEVAFFIELFHSHHGTIENKDKTQIYQVYDFLIETSHEGLRITKEEFKQSKFNDLQKKLMTAALENKPIKIRGYIDQWGYGTDEDDSYFRYIRFNFRIVEVEILEAVK